MNRLLLKLLAKKRTVLYFLFAILLPVFLVGYLGFNTLSTRREAVKNLLASNLWVSAEAALRSIEDSLLEQEKTALSPESFSRLVQSSKPEEILSSYAINLGDVRGKQFLLDSSYQILIPQTSSEAAVLSPWMENLLGSAFVTSLQRAESLEFAEKNYALAADYFRRSAQLAESKEQKAMALEGLGRCLLSSQSYSAAYSVYQSLSSEYGGELNKAGHPYGIIAQLQLSEIERRRGRGEDSSRILLDLYNKIRNGSWIMNLASYEFFTAEVEANLEREAGGEKSGKIQSAYKIIKDQLAPYLEALVFADFLKSEIIPKIKERIPFVSRGSEQEPGRLLSNPGKHFGLISYSILPGILTGESSLGGFYWDPDSLKNAALPKILRTVGETSGLHLQIIDQNRPDIPTGAGQSAPENSVTLSFIRFPFPWKLTASQPALRDLERAVRRENLFYGLLLVVIVILMVMGASLIMRDISRERETMRQKTEFVNNISHELKTPLTLIRLYGETLERKEDMSREQRREAYEIITKESERLTHMINNVLDFSRIDMGRKEFYFKKGDLAVVVRDALNSYRYHLEKKGFAIHQEIASDLPEIEFDAEGITSVLINLLGNAMNFSPEHKNVTVRLFREENKAVLQVEDQGIGIPAKEIKKIFERFYRVKNEAVAEARGSGLGLPLVKHIVEAHGGEVEVRSEPGQGSAFSVILPFERSEKGQRP